MPSTISLQTTALLTALFLATPLAAAQAVTMNQKPRPGLINAESTLYPLDIAADQALIALNLADPGDVVYERASEALLAAENNNTEAAEMAVQQAASVADAAQRGNTTGLEKAESLLEEVRKLTPDNANVGLDTALENVRRAQDRIPDNVPVTS